MCANTIRFFQQSQTPSDHANTFLNMITNGTLKMDSLRTTSLFYWPHKKLFKSERFKI